MGNQPSPDESRIADRVDLDIDAAVLGTDERRAADSDTPFVIIPRGGCRQVGRSCYHVQTREGDYLVDCGIAQGGDTVGYPDFQGIEERSLDGVFLTHAHIDHSGALPILEHQNLLARSAPVICTRPTGALVHTLLHDSLKIHKEEAREMGQDQQFTRDDVHDLLNRVKAIQYESGFARQYIDVDENDEDLQFQFGDAGHLLGSAWLALESGGRRVVFSGDLGGRSAHLCDIENPPSADTLLLESTYGDRNTHASLDDARRELFEEIVDAVERGIPVLIPTFAVGRAQEILQTIRQYWQQLPEEQRDEFTVVYDGMAQDATDTYHAFATDGYINDSVLNYKMNAGDNEPFLPECAHRPTDPDERPLLLEGTDSPVIVSPSGMLTGGLSPVYLLDLVRNYDAAKVLFVGYQAEGTPGRKLQDATGEMCRVHLPTRDWDEPEYNDGHTVSIPTDWVRTIDGMSGHAAANTLMQFAREVDPTHISLIHGEANRQRQFKDFLETNTTADVVSLTGIQTPFAVGEADESIHLQAGMDRVGDVEPTGDDPVRDESTESVDDVVDQDAAVEDQVDALQAYVRHLEREIASLRNDNGWTEAEIREVVRDEMK